jgi:acetyl esterase/lipase
MALQTQFAKQILDWMKVLATENPSSNFYKKLDFNHIALAGHSHGGKLAAYIHAEGETIPQPATHTHTDTHTHIPPNTHTHPH